MFRTLSHLPEGMAGGPEHVLRGPAMTVATDDVSDGTRAAMLFHDAATGTVGHGHGIVNDVVSVR